MRAMIVWLVVIFFSVSTASAQGESPNLPLAKHIRAVHFVLRAVPYETAKKLVDLASKSGMNTIIVQLTDGVQLDHAPWTARKGAWRKVILREWATYARSKGLSIVPELKLLTHQGKFFQRNFPQLMFNRKTYDPRKMEVYAHIFPFMDEVIELLQPEAIHIGHDEVMGWDARHAKKKPKSGEVMLSASLFVQDTLKIHEYLKKKGIETWMWGDMLVSPNEFPNMMARLLHGSTDGYGKIARDLLPKDIVICDWHYYDNKEFLTVKVLQQEGFRVIGATWKKEKSIKNFSRYAANHGAYGMIATTWWHVQRKEWDVVDRIINFSGKAFLMDFPDAK